ncbi:MAG: hypothetical protein ACREJD_05565 [Phycisphaerales bacterium]
MLLISIRACSLAVVAGLATGAAAQSSWNNTNGGHWVDATNWNPQSVPNSINTDVVIGVPGVYTVFLLDVFSVRNLTISNPDATVYTRDGRIVAYANLTIDGTLRVSNPISLYSAIAQISGDSLGGSGQIELDGASFGSPSEAIAQLALNTAGGTTIGPNLTIRGRGYISGSFKNNGVITADIPGKNLEMLSSGPVSNGGLIEAAGGDLHWNVTNTIVQGAFGEIRADTSTLVLDTAEITGGAVGSENGGKVIFDGNNSLNGVTLYGDVQTGDFPRITFNHDGVVRAATIAGRLSAFPNGRTANIGLGTNTSFTGGGSILLGAEIGSESQSALSAGAGITSPVATISSGFTLLGTGTIYVPVVNAGTFQAGTENARGRMLIYNTRSFTNQATGIVRLDLFSPANSGQIVSQGPVALGGTLRVRIPAGSTIPSGASFDLISAPSITGNFTTLDLPSDRAWKVTKITGIGEQVIHLASACPADFNHDGQVDDADFLVFVVAYNNLEDTNGDLNEDDVTDDADFSIFVAAYDALLCP